MAKFDFYFICQWIAFILFIYVMVVIFNVPNYRYEYLDRALKNMNLL